MPRAASTGCSNERSATTRSSKPHLLRKKGYQIKIFNTINFEKSMHYNPMAYIHSEKDILKLVTALIANTKGDGKAGDEFWTSATRSQAVKSLRTGNGFPLFGELIV